ncbi:MAG: M20 family metallopeptidase [Verrucomicrobiales bacterium]|jgi:acetylornithine deacetylase/succinyl-diaminopimelate desuccinylase-like protein|nr:M20 family metallopeptidase [Verrucomicrobiales bacterium]
MTVSVLSPTAKLLRQLVRIPSVNPHGQPGVSVSETGERACAEAVGEFLRRAGAAVELREVLPGRPNVIGVFKPRGKVTRRLLLAPHTDTVSVSGMTIRPFAATVSGGKLYGRGASDTKGPLAAMLRALREFTVSAAFRRGGLEITFAGLMGEEAGNHGARAWARQGPRYDLAIIGEPTEWRVVHAHKGCAWLTFTVSGRAAHAATPAAGVNAITAATPLLLWLEQTMTPRLAKFTHPSLGPTTLAITTISGGTKDNIIPDRCEIHADLRYTPPLTAGRAARLIRAGLRQRGLRATVSVNSDNRPLHTPADNALVRAILPHTRGLTTAPWFCDAALFGARGIPAVALGPGSIRQAHTAAEFIRLADLERGKDGYLKILAALV